MDKTHLTKTFTKRVIFTMVILFCFASYCECYEDNSVESRGKKKKIALFVYFADLVLKKFFILKLIYAFVFWVVLHKAGYFLSWFVSYIKDQKKYKHHHEEYVPHHEYHDHYDHNHSPYGNSYGPYRRQTLQGH